MPSQRVSSLPTAHTVRGNKSAFFLECTLLDYVLVIKPPRLVHTVSNGQTQHNVLQVQIVPHNAHKTRHAAKEGDGQAKQAMRMDAFKSICCALCGSECTLLMASVRYARGIIGRSHEPDATCECQHGVKRDWNVATRDLWKNDVIERLDRVELELRRASVTAGYLSADRPCKARRNHRYDAGDPVGPVDPSFLVSLWLAAISVVCGEHHSLLEAFFSAVCWRRCLRLHPRLHVCVGSAVPEHPCCCLELVNGCRFFDTSSKTSPTRSSSAASRLRRSLLVRHGFCAS